MYEINESRKCPDYDTIYRHVYSVGLNLLWPIQLDNEQKCHTTQVVTVWH